MFPGILFRSPCSSIPPPNTFYPPVFVSCFVILLLLPCHNYGSRSILIFHGPMFPGLYMLPSTAYLCSNSQCFFIFDVSYLDLFILCLVFSLFCGISISLFHTPVVSHFIVLFIFLRSFVPRYLYVTHLHITSLMSEE